MSKKNKQRVNINLDPINWVYVRANEINLSQLLNDALREKRWNDERAAFEAIYLDPNVVQLCETPVNNHGCRGFGVSIRVVNDRTGTVVAGYGCSSCWQVGHDDASSPIEVGTTVKLPEWCASWDEAKRLVGYSHNELIDDRDEPQPDTTRVTPYQLAQGGAQ